MEARFISLGLPDPCPDWVVKARELEQSRGTWWEGIIDLTHQDVQQWLADDGRKLADMLEKHGFDYVCLQIVKEECLPDMETEDKNYHFDYIGYEVRIKQSADDAWLYQTHTHSKWQGPYPCQSDAVTIALKDIEVLIAEYYNSVADFIIIQHSFAPDDGWTIEKYLDDDD